MGVKSTRKGANGEREVMSILREHGYPVERGGQTSMGLVASTWRSRGPNVPRFGAGWNRARGTPRDSGTVYQL